MCVRVCVYVHCFPVLKVDSALTVGDIHKKPNLVVVVFVFIFVFVLQTENINEQICKL